MSSARPGVVPSDPSTGSHRRGRSTCASRCGLPPCARRWPAAGRGRAAPLPRRRRGQSPAGVGRTTVTPGLGRAIAAAYLLAPGEDGPPGERLALLPAGPSLARAELELLLAGGRERALTEALRPVLADYDVALLGCPASLGPLPLMA